jgi:phage terminase large subunit-like protein
MAFETLQPLTDKLARARPLQGRMQQGRVYFPTNKPWMQEVTKELLRFPAGAHDDIVDAMAWCTHLTLGKSPRKLPGIKKIPSWRDKLKTGSGDASHMTA